MTRVAVTGGSGKLGRAVVSELAGRGYDVVTLDRQPAPGIDPTTFTRVDFADWGQTRQALSRIDRRYTGVDWLVHLAAIPGPGHAPNATVFANNVLSTYNVFTAAVDCGIRNVVWASSETLLGIPFDTDPPYVPVDERVPATPQSSYALGKAVDEELARHLTRWCPELKLVGLRFSNVKTADEYAGFADFQSDPALRRWNLWGYVDARDGAQAVRLSLESDLVGAHTFVVAAADTVMEMSSSELVAQQFPEVALDRPLEGNETLLSIRSAREVLGYEPRHSWRSGGRVGGLRRPDLP